VTRRRIKGEGSIYQIESSKRWVAQMTLPNGQRRSKSSMSQKVVRDWLTDQKKSAKDGLYVTDDQVRLGDFMDRYMSDIAYHNLRPRSFESHNGYVRNHIKPELGHFKLSDLRPEHVQAFYTKKLREGLSKRTVQYIHAILHKVLDQAFKWGLVTRNVTDLVDVPRPDNKPPTVWSADQIRIFLQGVESSKYYPIYMLAVYTGMRQGEILGIHREDVNLKDGTIYVKHQLQPIKGEGLVVTNVKTKKSKRSIALPSIMVNLLKEHLRDVKSGLIFTSPSGQPIWAANVYRQFKKAIRDLELPDIRFHDLRHAHATLLLQAGVNPKVVQERLGHSQISLTLDTYSHVIPSLQRDAAEKIEALLAETV